MAKKKKTAAPKKRRARTINVAALIEALEKHILGETEMTATQVNAALALLKKTLPDVTPAGSRAHEDALNDLA